MRAPTESADITRADLARVAGLVLVAVALAVAIVAALGRLFGPALALVLA